MGGRGGGRGGGGGERGRGIGLPHVVLSGQLLILRVETTSVQLLLQTVTLEWGNGGMGEWRNEWQIEHKMRYAGQI